MVMLFSLDSLLATAAWTRRACTLHKKTCKEKAALGVLMSSGCISSGCIDARAPVRANYVNLYKWPESDAEFVRSVARRGGDGFHSGCGRRTWGPSPTVVDSYSCRQMYLRSYTFSRKESVPEKTRRCLGKVRERAADLPIFPHRRETTETAGCVEGQKSSKRKRKKKGCLSRTRKLKEVSCNALYAIFHRLLSCTTSVEVA